MPSARERVLESAAELFPRRGFARTSLAAIAESADLTTGAIYGHFDGKGALLVAVVERALRALPIWQLLGKQQTSESAGSLYGRLGALYTTRELHHVRRLAIEVHAAAARDEQIAELVAQSNAAVVAAVESLLKAGVASGELAPLVNCDHAARFLLVLIMGLSHLDTLDPALVGDADAEWEAFITQGLVKLTAG